MRPVTPRAHPFWRGVLTAVVALGTTAGLARPTAAAGQLVWRTCPTAAGEQCATVPVPLDYARPSAGTIDLAVARVPASGTAQGDLLVNPGGPGESGVDLLPVLAGELPPAVRQHLNVVTFDERGTGSSDRLVCGPSPAAVAALDPAPTTPKGDLPGTVTFRALADACARRHATLLPTVDTTVAARDMDRIRQALGDERIDYYGLSYGTVLGAEYATRFGPHVRAMVLDGAVDPTEPLAQQATAEAPAIAASLDHYLASCAATPSCPLGPDASAVYDALARQLAGDPLVVAGRPVTVGDLLTATLFALSAPGFTPGFPAAVAAATHGDGAPLASLAASFDEDVDGSSLVAPMWAITCQDAAGHPGPAAAGSLARSLAAADPPDGAEAVSNNLAGCVDWPPANQPITSVHGPPGLAALVIGTTGDPNTPYASARRLVRTLGHARLLTWIGQGHTWLLNGSADSCMRATVSDYLLAGRLPPAGATCF